MWVEPGRDYGSRVTDNVRAGTDITKELEAAKGRIISQWPLTPQEVRKVLFSSASPNQTH